MWSSPISIIIVNYAITVIEKKWHLVHQKSLKNTTTIQYSNKITPYEYTAPS